jgi:hypothetical protein
MWSSNRERSSLRQCFLVSVLLLAGLIGSHSANAQSGSIAVVANGIAGATIVVADIASDEVKTAAGELVRYIRLSTGVELKILKESELPATPQPLRLSTAPAATVAPPSTGNATEVMAKIVVKTVKGTTDAGSNAFAVSDGFSITFPDNHTVLISGLTDSGTEFGVYEFLERYVGVKWLMPGQIGEHVPKLASLLIPTGDVRQEPAFLSRVLSGLINADQRQWARRNRMHVQIEFHHNLFRILPPIKYTQTHPEYFPIINGKRYLPADNEEGGWQPCFTALGSVEEAVKNICAYFAEYPWRVSYSLGVNDRAGHCECDACRAKDGTATNFLGAPNRSNSYYEWASAVVQGVLQRYPDKWFGCLAYSGIAEPPTSVGMHPRIVPHMTFDRIRWASDQFRTEGHEATANWKKKSPVLGWYDYICGTPYLLPRVYFHTMADYYRYGRDEGVQSMYSEAYPNWGEGPKLYLALKLQWNPYLDVDSTLQEWYVAAVGTAAAPYLAAYYDLWEEFWTKRVLTTPWFNDKREYLAFYLPDYLKLVTGEDIQKSRNLLENVVAKAGTDEETARARLLLRAFEYYEASVISYLGIVMKDSKLTEAGAMSLKRQQLLNEFASDPVLVHPSRYDKYPSLVW